MKWNALLCVSAAVLFISSCSNTLDVFTQYKETIVVFGLLDQLDTATYIKINKAFVGPGNAITIAQNYDSVNFANVLTVQLQQISNGNLVKTITLTRDSSISKLPGTFSYPEQILYKTKAKLDSSCQYNLIVTDNSTHVQVTGTTQLISNFTIAFPYGAINFTNPSGPQIQFAPALNGKIYGVTVRFYYYELNKFTHQLTAKSLDWVLPNQTANSSQGACMNGNPCLLDVSISNSAFFQYLGAEIPALDNTTLWRYPGDTIDLIYSIGSPDLSTYIAVTQPTNSITQIQPQFSDIKGSGFGLFASRYVTTQTAIGMNLNSYDSLYYGRFTKSLFCNPNTNSSFFCSN